MRVNALSPGGVFNNQDPEFVERLTRLIPMGRMAEVDEYRAAVQFLCSDASRYMTGQNIIMDGGRSVLDGNHRAFPHLHAMTSRRRSNMFDDKSILITGGTGSFGRIRRDPADELQAAPSRDLLARRAEAVRDAAGVRSTRRCATSSATCATAIACARPCEGVDFVVHAAALKQVPAAEYNPFECIKTNIHGAENVIDAALDHDVEQVIALSTDKAAQPDQPVRRHQARVGQAVRRRQQHGGRPADPLSRRALRQRGRLARLGRAVLPQAARRRRAISCRSPTRA